MKTLLAFITFMVMYMSLYPPPPFGVVVKSQKVYTSCKYGQCLAIARSTKQRCKNCSQAGSSYCYSHAK